MVTLLVFVAELDSLADKIAESLFVTDTESDMLSASVGVRVNNIVLDTVCDAVEDTDNVLDALNADVTLTDGEESLPSFSELLVFVSDVDTVSEDPDTVVEKERLALRVIVWLTSAVSVEVVDLVSTEVFVRLNDRDSVIDTLDSADSVREVEASCETDADSDEELDSVSVADEVLDKLVDCDEDLDMEAANVRDSVVDGVSDRVLDKVVDVVVVAVELGIDDRVSEDDVFPDSEEVYDEGNVVEWLVVTDLETDSDVVDDLNKLPEAVAELDVSVPDTVADACVPESVTDSETVDACDRLAEDDAACVMEEEFVGLADTVAVVVTDRDTERDTVSASVAVEDTENV